MSSQTQGIASDGGSKADELTDHVYDGIREYDNPIPGWWNWLFILTIAFSAVYFAVSVLSDGQFAPRWFYERAKVENTRRQYGELGADVRPTARRMLELAAIPKWREVGQVIFASNCVSCHGADAGGVSGPNLTDDLYIHVRGLEDIADVIAKGRKNGAMPAHEGRLLPVEITLVSAYVASLRGQNRPTRWNGEQGRPIDPWPALKDPERAGH